MPQDTVCLCCCPDAPTSYCACPCCMCDQPCGGSGGNRGTVQGVVNVTASGFTPPRDIFNGFWQLPYIPHTVGFGSVGNKCLWSVTVGRVNVSFYPKVNRTTQSIRFIVKFTDLTTNCWVRFISGGDTIDGRFCMNPLSPGVVFDSSAVGCGGNEGTVTYLAACQSTQNNCCGGAINPVLPPNSQVFFSTNPDVLGGSMLLTWDAFYQSWYGSALRADGGASYMSARFKCASTGPSGNQWSLSVCDGAAVPVDCDSFNNCGSIGCFRTLVPQQIHPFMWTDTFPCFGIIFTLTSPS